MKTVVVYLVIVVLMGLAVAPAVAQEPKPPLPPGCYYESDCLCQGRIAMSILGWMNVRQSPGGVVIGSLYRGAGFSVYAKTADGNWYQTYYYDGLYWVTAEWTTIETPDRCAGLPVK